ncbi:MAG TPA: hypothetical protein VJ600_00905 [Holophagaceae bacterium]|nr:hypothetical protein [Holophagaceae bacterium]
MYRTLALLPLLLLACGGGGGGSSSSGGTSTPPRPAIASFLATPSVIAPGQSSTLAWTVQNATTVTLDGSAITATSKAVTPSATTTYLLTATGSGGSVSASVTVSVGTLVPKYGDFSGADLGNGANLNGAIPFPADNAWNTDISTAPVDPDSANLIASIGLTTGLHPDFGSGLWAGAPIGIPYRIVSSAQALVPVAYQAYGDESDPGPFPIPADAPIEGQMADGSSFGGDRHVLVIDRDANRLFELDRTFPQADGSWWADSGALFWLDSNTVRPGGQPGWTSADAAGLPIFPGLARYEEAASGAIRHALRFTVGTTRRAYVPPATHVASNKTGTDLPPMGMRVRLKAAFVIPNGYSPESKAILMALKTYGMFVADNGSNWYLSGAPDPRWNNGALNSELGAVKGSDFEVVQMTGLVVVP